MDTLLVIKTSDQMLNPTCQHCGPTMFEALGEFNVGCWLMYIVLPVVKAADPCPKVKHYYL